MITLHLALCDIYHLCYITWFTDNHHPLPSWIQLTFDDVEKNKIVPYNNFYTLDFPKQLSSGVFTYGITSQQLDSLIINKEKLKYKALNDFNINLVIEDRRIKY